ncbi:uncharacterized protein LOC111028732 [Myzus persicae]|uniref:uncharacterized protein LOC111028732 n=1 Tax=Myzus persicae TaxID=13164 RepID=UPI000B9380A7|nr:uncharacterized protein LOC111028732 [Myzus persicae]
MIFPTKYTNEIVGEIGNTFNIRSNLKCMEDINNWVSEFGELNFTHWNYRSSIPNGQRIVCSKKFVCQHSSFKKPDVNKKGLSKNANCPATIDITIKLNTTATKKKDPFIKEFFWSW